MTTTDDALHKVLAHLPEVRGRLDDNHLQAWQAVDPVLLELCRLRVAMLLGAEAEHALRTPAAVDAGLDESKIADLANWPTSSHFSETERACLAFTEQFVIDVAALDDTTAGAVAQHLGEAGLANFTNALLVVEQRQRLTLTWEKIL